MKLLLLALGCVLVHGAPVEQGPLEQGSCEDAQTKFTAGLALTAINQNQQEGYVLAMHRLSNVFMKTHAETGVVFYLTIDVVETNCSVHSKRDWKTCEARPTSDTPVYGQCKAVIYINRPHKVVRLYKYSCEITPVPSEKVNSVCPDCPTPTSKDSAEIQKTVTQSLEKFNKESGLPKRFALLKIERATSGMAMSMYYNVQFSIQETTCTKDAAADNCPPMSCEFAHKGFCKGSLYYTPTGEPEVSVECEVFEPEAAEREKKLHEASDADHPHSDTATHNHNHDQAHPVDQAHPHDHIHDHTLGHDHHDATHKHAPDSGHHHTHDHGVGSGHSHAHPHSHDHGHDHDHEHAHHAKAHDHKDDFPHQHHDYKHADGVNTHEHDHEMALDHDHKHEHMHKHEHHHHHHGHDHEESHNHPQGMVRVLPAMNQPMTLPSFPDVPAAGPEVGVTLPLNPDPQVPGMTEPFIEAYPTTVSAQCSPPPERTTLVENMFAEDPRFKPAA